MRRIWAGVRELVALTVVSLEQSAIDQGDWSLAFLLSLVAEPPVQMFQDRMVSMSPHGRPFAPLCPASLGGNHIGLSQRHGDPDIEEIRSGVEAKSECKSDSSAWSWGDGFSQEEDALSEEGEGSRRSCLNTGAGTEQFLDSGPSAMPKPCMTPGVGRIYFEVDAMVDDDRLNSCADGPPPLPTSCSFWKWSSCLVRMGTPDSYFLCCIPQIHISPAQAI